MLAQCDKCRISIHWNESHTDFLFSIAWDSCLFCRGLLMNSLNADYNWQDVAKRLLLLKASLSKLFRADWGMFMLDQEKTDLTSALRSACASARNDLNDYNLLSCRPPPRSFARNILTIRTFFRVWRVNPWEKLLCVLLFCEILMGDKRFIVRVLTNPIRHIHIQFRNAGLIFN